MADETRTIKVLELEAETEKAYLIRISGRDEMGMAVEANIWLPKSKVSYTAGQENVVVPNWLLDKKIESEFGADRNVSIY